MSADVTETTVEADSVPSSAQHTPSPWTWIVHDYSMATLGGPDHDFDSVMAVTPCGACANREKARALREGRDPEWKFGRCQTPSMANARLIAAAPELLEALTILVAHSGYANMTDEGLRREADLGNGFAPTLLKARAAIEKATGAA
jgi:hypothetical protein